MYSRLWLIVFCVLLTRAGTAATPAFKDSVQPFLTSHCTFCHNDQLKTADLSFDHYQDEGSALKDAQVWRRVKQMLDGKMMPPAPRPRPSPEEVAVVLDWIDANLSSEDTQPNPGRVTARRLNRAEYNNTVRDLLGIDFRPADDFPVDDTGYGFDNIGDVLSISPVLMEKYMTAADKSVRRAIMTDRSVKPTVLRYSAPRAEGEQRQIGAAGRVAYSPEGRLAVRHLFPATGEYDLHLRFVDRRTVLERRMSWTYRVPELIEQVSELEVKTIDLDMLGEELCLSLDYAIRFMEHFDVTKVGGTFVFEREKMLSELIEYQAWLEENPEGPPLPPPPALPVVFTLEGKKVATYSAEPKLEYEVDDPVRVRVEAGEREFYAEVLNPEGERWNPNSLDWTEYQSDLYKNEKRMVFADSIEIKGPFNPEPAPLPESHREIMVCDPEPDGFDRICAEKIVGRLVRLAFRRPVTEKEVGGYVRFAKNAVAEGASFERGIQLALKAILVSPQFLFRVERDPEPARPNPIRPIDDFELASRLSYFLWSSMPDEALLDAAARGELRTEDGRRAQVMRMIGDGKSQALVENFAGQWLQLRNVSLVKPDPEIFPEFDEELRAGMVRESELFFERIMREDRSILEFLKADYTFLNERLARHYGIDGVAGPEFRRVRLSGEQRGGVLTQASVLTVSSYPTRTSAVLRGLWVLENLLGDRPPDPPEDVPELDEQAVGNAASLRQQLERHRADPSCAVCHERMDAIGFGLENYNAIGGWRTADGNFPIDATGELPGGTRFDGPAGLTALLYAQQDQFARNLTEKVLTYALGRGLESYDEPAVEEIRSGLARGGYRFSSLVLGVVESMPFQMRVEERSD